MHYGVDTKHTLTQDELDQSGIIFEPMCAWNKSLPPRLLHTQHNGQPTKQRRYTVASVVTPTSGLGVYNNTVHTVERALLERYFMIKTKNGFVRPLSVKPKEFASKYFVDFRDAVASKVAEVATVLSDAQVVALYAGPKHKLYHDAMVSLCRIPLNKGDAKIRQFPKMEKQDLAKAPRIINPRSPRYNLELGKYLKALEKPVYKAINEVWESVAEHTVIKGLNCYDAAEQIRKKWDRFHQPVAIGLDATKWDAHVSVFALAYEHSLYNLIFRCKLLRTLLSWQIVNRGKSHCDDGSVEFMIEGTRASGDINTSLGNCFLACAILKAYVDKEGIDAELVNNGDDCVIILEAADRDRFMSNIHQHYTNCGFRIEVEEPVDQFEKLEFCQTRPIFDGSAWRLMRNPLACMKKDGMCLLPLTSRKAYEKWMGAVGECGLAAASGLPMLQSWYNMFVRGGRPCSRRFRRHIFAHTFTEAYAHGLRASIAPVTSEARISFYAGTGITPDLQIAYEQFFDSVELTSNFEHQQQVVYQCKSVPIIEMAPDIFDYTEYLKINRKYGQRRTNSPQYSEEEEEACNGSEPPRR